MLAIRILQEQGVQVDAVNFKTMFTCCQDQAGAAARELNVRLTTVGADDNYLEIVRQPRFGYGKGANPCVDCRIYMFQRARRFMEQIGAQFVITGEVVGQRPFSQKRRDLEVIAYHAGLEGLLLRPLSALLLPVTTPEEREWVNRSRLYGFSGRSRKGLLELAAKLKLRGIPESPSTGCALTETRFAAKVRDLLDRDLEASALEFRLLQVGRHFAYDAATKVIVGRREDENEQLRSASTVLPEERCVLLEPHDFVGPCVLVIGPVSASAMDFASGLLWRYSRQPTTGGTVAIQQGEQRRLARAVSSEIADRAATISGSPHGA